MRLRYDPEVVETGGAVLWHPVGTAQRHLGGDAASGSGDRSGQNGVQNGDGRVASHYEERPAPHLGKFTPPNLAASDHHGSSAIASRNDATAASISDTWAGMRR